MVVRGGSGLSSTTSTIDGMIEVTLRDARAHLDQLLTRVVRDGEAITITRDGRPEAVLVSMDAYAELQELRKEEDRRLPHPP